jgi:ABC-type phosphate transport system substrate-binding protein
MRNAYFFEIPPDVEWYKVENLTDEDLDQLYVVNHATWRDAADQNELLKVASRRRAPLTMDPSNWESPVLFGHDEKGPFSIIEGNNRLTAYAASRTNDLNIPVYVGISELKCVWHVLDNCEYVNYDLLRW